MRRALVVDDSRVGRLMIRTALPAGWDVELVEASDGQQAIDLLTSERFDVVFLDLMMPLVDGYEVLQWLQEKGMDMIVVVVSSDLQPAAKARALTLGAFEFVRKPPDHDRMRDALELAGLL
jgi:CheY-like chemotaxis protein